MVPMLVLDAFGDLSTGTSLIDSEEEDLYSVFRARGELMGWCTMSPNGSLLWDMHEAELTSGIDSTGIGFVQVGLRRGIRGVLKASDSLSGPVFTAQSRETGWAPFPMSQMNFVEPAVVLPALTQCFIDALGRFGAVELSGLQVTASYLEPGTRPHGNDLPYPYNWFNTDRKITEDAIISFSHELLENHASADLIAGLSGKRLGRFQLGPAVTVPEQCWIEAPADGPLSRYISPAHSGRGLSVRMPEWTASAVGWVLAIVIDAARASTPDVPHFAIRVTRIR